MCVCCSNHKALLDEVMRLEELAGDLCLRLDRVEAETKVLTVRAGRCGICGGRVLCIGRKEAQ